MNDAEARRFSVAPEHSVIVQAPAGSGKTTLLVERYLALLNTVEAPEAILAITFTRKAAAEMRDRVLRYLDPDFQSDAPHERDALIQARAASERVSAWGLLQNPHRMLIRTIDSFNHFLARSMPVASALGPVPAPAEDARMLYRQAARQVLSNIDRRDPLAADVRCLLEWRDHNTRDIESLLTELLARRDQWLRALSIDSSQGRHRLEATLRELVVRELQAVEDTLQQTLKDSQTPPDALLGLLNFANRHRPPADAESATDPLTRLPGSDPADLAYWRQLADMLLTKDRNVKFRSRVDARNGFPPKTDEKRVITELLAKLREYPLCAEALNRARALPSPTYADAEWTVLDALVRVLFQCATHLELIFARQGQTDYTGLSAAALRGLGDEVDGFTDLGLALDQRIQHILVDEFQDTNRAQHHLLQKLTAGWQSGDGRSLFVVGDPMQSIYRFREAEVGLFIRSRQLGIGEIKLADARLLNNYRSRPEIVNWVNEHIGPTFPAREDIAAGAVAFASSTATRSPGGCVNTWLFNDPADEAAAIINALQQALALHAEDAEFKAAVIVRARSQLMAIVSALQLAQIPYRAVKLDPLTDNSVVQDLLAITKVLLHPADVASWLAILRSPACGLQLTDLYALCGESRSLFDNDALTRLPADAAKRAARVFRALEEATHQYARRPIADLVEGVWQHIGGPQCSPQSATAMQLAQQYLTVLNAAEASGALLDWNDFLELLTQQKTEASNTNPQVKLELLTMHGAKGLEWDLVFLPGLAQPTRQTGPSLLHWLPLTNADAEEQILLAPLRASDAHDNPALVNLIRTEQYRRDALEQQRLMYVAATRARERLVLSGSLNIASDQPLDSVKPRAGSLMANLWPTCREQFLHNLRPGTDAGSAPADAVAATLLVPDQRLQRVHSDWTPVIPSTFQWHLPMPTREHAFEVEYDWAGSDARRSGTVLHRVLEEIGRLGIEQLSDIQQHHFTERIPTLLMASGVRSGDVTRIANDLQLALEETLDSDVGQWLLSNQHAMAACELPLSGVLDGEIVHAVIDRTFVDAHGVRWIIDYKTGYHAGADLQAFLYSERSRYEAQLDRYRRLFAQLEDRSIRTALFFPRHQQLVMVEAPPASDALV